ncbi:MAG: ribosome biogenesis GTPase Der, partial [Actinobacteria bacterium]|nr:ribosome biogenesis GTPase Der [Actinomycetota bacterium]
MTSTDRLPLVAIVGRPNVGKSTLMNRILGRRIAIVEEKSGVTRDRKEVQAEWLGYEFRLVDTGGWMVGGNSLDKKVSRQSEQAIKEADVILFVVDAAIGVTDEDASVGELLRQATAPVLLIANKVDDQRHEAGVWELLSLGLGDPIGISALHGRGTGDMLDQIIAFLPEPEPTEEEIAAENDDGITSIALVGRPNVGKSTLFNRLIGEDRAVVHDMPGTTRDSVDTVVETEVGPLRFIDTAGMRRKSRIDDGTEYFSMVRALKSVDKANVALLVIDATEGITHQDQRLAERVDG